jgi:xanthine dehydrogenase/oxidase
LGNNSQLLFNIANKITTLILFRFDFGCNIPAMVAIYHYDGTVACTHAGIEMGQGLHTKVMQTIAQSFQIPMDKIKIKPTNNFIGANAFPSGGSIASELASFVCH